MVQLASMKVVARLRCSAGKRNKSQVYRERDFSREKLVDQLENVLQLAIDEHAQTRT